MTEDEEFLLVVEVCEGVDAIGGADFAGPGLADGALELFSVGGEP